MLIKEMAKKYNINASTIRYYESEGLIPPVKKDSNGIRNFTSDDEKAIEFVVCLRNSGVSIETIKKYMKLLRLGKDSKKERIDLLKKEKVKIDKQIKKLKETSLRLKNKIEWTQNN